MLEEEQYYCKNCDEIVFSNPCPGCGMSLGSLYDVSEFEDDYSGSNTDVDGPTYSKKTLKKALLNDGLDEAAIGLVDEMSFGDWDEDAGLAEAV